MGHELAWWLNVGVQIFFVMSGYLYGLKGDEYYSWEWLKRSFRKIFIDYYVYIFIIIVVFLIFFKDLLLSNILAPIGSLLLVQNYVGDIPGLEHLWYIPYILVCYLLTPAFNKLYQIIEKYNEVVYWSVIIGSLLYLQLIALVGAICINVAWLSCYVFGFFMSKRYVNEKRKNDILNIQSMTAILVPITLVAVGIRIYFEYITDMTIAGMFASLLNLFITYSRSLLGITLFFASLLILNKYSFKNGKLREMLDWTDKYSYDIYIVHQVYILGSLSLIGYTSYLALDILLIVVLIIISAIVLKYLSNMVEKMLIHPNKFKVRFEERVLN